MWTRFFPGSHLFYCPDEHQLAAYVDQQLIGEERERVESHLTRCDSCLRQVGFLIKKSGLPENSAPSSLLRQAKILGTAAPENPVFAWKWLSVAAACAVIAVALLVWHNARTNTEESSTALSTVSQASAPGLPPPEQPEADVEVRSISPVASQPLVVLPQPGAIIHASDFTIRWEPVPNAAAYEVRVVTADGDLVWRERVHENSVTPPKQTLRVGMKYFVWVRVWLTNGKTQQSAAVGFVVG